MLSVLDALGIAHRLTAADLQWGSGGHLASPDSWITFVPEPAAYGAVKVHSNLPEYRFVAREATDITDAERALLEEHGIFDIHARHKARCVGFARQSGAIERSGATGQQ